MAPSESYSPGKQLWLWKILAGSAKEMVADGLGMAFLLSCSIAISGDQQSKVKNKFLLLYIGGQRDENE